MSDESDIIINKAEIMTTDKLYNSVYYNQLLEVNRLAFAFLISQLFLRIIDHTLLEQFKSNNYLYLSILIVLLIALMLIAVKVFTFIKISNEKDELMKKLTK
jgi:hypothetical protein